jgi:low affinity Fe/Cu permease
MASRGSPPGGAQGDRSPGPGAFSRFARAAARLAGTPIAFVVAIAAIVIWGVVGPVFHFSDTWQLVINTGTTIVTFLMVFLIQHAQNTDSRAIQLKLDEILRAIPRADSSLIDTEDLSSEELERLTRHYRHAAERARARANARTHGGRPPHRDSDQ